MSVELFKVRCENSRSEVVVKAGTSLLELLSIIELKGEFPFIAAYVNNRSCGLNYRIYNNITVRFIDQTHFEGARVYERTLLFMLCKSAKDIFPNATLTLHHTMVRGVYFELKSAQLGAETATLLSNRIKELATLDIPITEEQYYYKDALLLFRDNNMDDKVALLESAPSLYITISRLADIFGGFYGVLAPSTASVSQFSIEPFHDGFYIFAPQRENQQLPRSTNNSPKIFDVMERHQTLLEVINSSCVASINKMVTDGRGSEIIKIGETVQEHNFAKLADTVVQKIREGVKLILISGPSSSGKTTFSNRLNIELKIYGFQPSILSMDDYFINREDTPILPNGKRDFEAVEALDLELLNNHLSELIAGNEVDVPQYNFVTGCRDLCGSKMKLSEKSVLIMEGIHALNPQITAAIAEDKKFNIYVSPLTSVQIDNTSLLHTTDSRLIRRIVRDFRYRNKSALDTLAQWGSVRRGEEKHIFPHIHRADYMFNTSLFFEISILKRYVTPLLMSVPDVVEEYSEARRLLKLLELFTPIEDKHIPPTSILREFIGGSSFIY